MKEWLKSNKTELKLLLGAYGLIVTGVMLPTLKSSFENIFFHEGVDDQIENYSNFLHENYNFNVIPSDEVGSGRDYDDGAVYSWDEVNQVEFRDVLKWVSQELAKYPHELFDENEINLYIVSDLILEDSNHSDLNEKGLDGLTTNNELIISLDNEIDFKDSIRDPLSVPSEILSISGWKDRNIVDSFNHELFHQFENFDNGGILKDFETGPSKGWLELVPDRNWIYGQYSESIDTYRHQGFVSSYADSSISEDRAETATYLMGGKIRGDLLDDSGVMQKVNKIKEYFNEWSDGLMDTQYWEDLENGKVDFEYWQNK